MHNHIHCLAPLLSILAEKILLTTLPHSCFCPTNYRSHNDTNWVGVNANWRNLAIREDALDTTHSRISLLTTTISVATICNFEFDVRHLCTLPLLLTNSKL